MKTFNKVLIDMWNETELKNFNKNNRVFQVTNNTTHIPNIEEYDYVFYSKRNKQYLYIAESLKDDASKLMFLLTHKLNDSLINQIMSTIDFGSFETYRAFYECDLTCHLTKKNFITHGLMSVIGTAKKYLIK